MSSAPDEPLHERGGLQPWSGGEREDFFSAIARHRRAAWRVTAVCAMGACILALVAAILLAPLLYCVLGLILDIINLVVPMPNLLGYAGNVVDAIVDPKPGVQPPLSALPLAAVPGLVVFALALYTLRRALRKSPLFDPDIAVGRRPNDSVLAEQRIENTVEEMAVAAGIPAPQVCIIEGGANAAAFGIDEAHATVLIGSALLDTLDRDQMQGVAGQLVSSIADGDMKIGLRTALTLGLFGLFARLGAGWADREEFAATVKLVRALLAPSSRNIQYILMQLAEPFTTIDENGERAATRSQPRENNKLTWREWALMPLVGPVVIAGFLCGLVSTMMLEPAVAFAWRTRKYMADASAVMLTRNPNGLASALVAMSGRSAGVAPWAGHLCVVDPGSRAKGGLFGSWASAIAFPRLDRRHRALQKMGADYIEPSRLVATRSIPFLAKLFLAVAIPTVCVLLSVAVVLLVWISAALSGMFTILPAAILHAILR